MHNNRVPRRTRRSLATATVLTAAAALAAAPLFSASAFAAHESAPGSISRLEPAKPAQLTGSAEWGLRQSFRSYIKTGPAHGSWELLDGATGEFNFPVDDGQSITAETPGTITFKGGVHFTGHDGQLDITIANPVVKFTGPDTADLLLNVKSKAMGAADVTDYGQIEFAKLSNITIQHDGEKKLTVKAPKVVLTAKGAQGFANFYKEGTELDPFSFEINETAAPSPTPTPNPTDPAPSPTDPSPSPTPDPSPSDPSPSPTKPTPSPTDPAPSPTDPSPSPTPTPDPSPKPPADNSQKPIADPCLADDACNLYFADQFPASIAKLGMKIPAGGEVIAGDWDGDGVSTVAIRNGENYTFYDSNRSDAKATTATFPGTGSGQVLVADFNGDKKDDIAVKNGNVFSIKYNATASGAADAAVPYGKAEDYGLAGDWDGDGKATLGVRRGYTNLLRDTLTGGEADRTFAYGRNDDVAYVGDWNGDGKDTVSVRRGAILFVKNALSGGDADTSFTYGRASDKLVVGDWTGTGKDTVAVVREQAKGGLG